MISIKLKLNLLQFKTTYEGQLQNLNDKLKSSNDLNEEQLKIRQEQINNLQSQLAQKKSIPIAMWLLVIIGIVIGILIGKGCN